MKRAGGDVIGIDWRVDLGEAWGRLGFDVAASILSVTDEEKLHYKDKEIIKLDTRIDEALIAFGAPLKLKSKLCDEGEISYHLYYKAVEMLDADMSHNEGQKELRGLWEYGFILRHSALGSLEPKIGVEITRVVTKNSAILPPKIYSYPMPFEFEFDKRWEHIELFIKNPPPAAWMSINSMISKLRKTPASLREVKEARSKLNKLKVDREDSETLERIAKALDWKRIMKAYDFKSMAEKPNKLWFSKADTPLRLFDLFSIISKEGSYCPTTVPSAIKESVLLYAGSVLTGSPDLSGVSIPPIIDWESN
jgi:hypothetical protein